MCELHVRWQCEQYDRELDADAKREHTNTRVVKPQSMYALTGQAWVPVRNRGLTDFGHLLLNNYALTTGIVLG